MREQTGLLASRRERRAGRLRMASERAATFPPQIDALVDAAGIIRALKIALEGKTEL